MKPPHLSACFDAGNFIFVSGQLPLGPDRAIVGATVAEQTQQVLRNVESALSQFALGRGDIVKTTVWLRPGAEFAGFNDAYAGFFAEHRPARSTVYSELALPGALVEIEAIAARRG
jgi:2-iminobutanoate/2-iminopropanoate deaminase